MKSLDLGQVLILHVKQQNAGLLIRRENDANGERVIFETFEASATSSSVLAAGSTMTWDFPGRSAYISLEYFMRESFQKCLATFLEQASMETIHYLQASAKKAGATVGEIRDTTDPALVTQMLMSLLEAIGGHYQADALRKRIRDDTNVSSDTIPWRRLPFWLILRVATQRHFCLSLGAEKGQVGYKFLMAILFSRLLDDSAATLDPHKVMCLRSKLARRMAKLEMHAEKIKLQGEHAGNDWLKELSTLVRSSIENANSKVAFVWEAFKSRTTRCIPHLPFRAQLDSLTLTLPNSGRYLDDVLKIKPSLAPSLGSMSLPNPLSKSIQRSQELTDCAFSVAALEQQIESAAQQWSLCPIGRNRCVELAAQIENVFYNIRTEYQGHVERLFNAGDSGYDFAPEQHSAMILATFTLWVELDRNAVLICPLLAEYAPVFRPELFDTLQLPTKSAVERLRHVQDYLTVRHASSIYGTLLELHGQRSFASRYVSESVTLRSLEHRIQRSCEEARQRKMEEYQRLCAEYQMHTDQIDQHHCLCQWDGTEKIIEGCTKCFHVRKRKRLQIESHEAFLPEEASERSTIVFELRKPEWFTAYRDVTCYILTELAHPYKPQNIQRAVVQLQRCEPLRNYMEVKVNRLTMASKTKQFRQTHYYISDIKSSHESIYVPFGAEFQLYDLESRIWIEDLTNPLTLEHLCGIQVPDSLLRLLPKRLHPPTTINGLTSYEIQANQAVVPAEVTEQAFSAYQKLMSGRRRRWPNILVELSSSNLNLSDEDTVRLICQLTSQAGPRLPSEPLGVVHEIFRYPVFTTRLMKVLKQMLELIRVNWREHNIMQLVITLALRLHSLSDESLGITVLTAARECLLGWILELRKKLHEVNDSVNSQRYATYGLHAALLCRQTFACFTDSTGPFTREDLSAWIQASIALQENTLHDLSKLSDNIRSSLLRDAKMMYSLHDQVRSSMTKHKQIVATEILRGSSSRFPVAEGTGPSWNFLPTPHEYWIVADTPGLYPDRMHFNYVQGHLLVNGKPRSKLPLDLADDKAVKYIFGNQHLLTYPSRQPGMSHRLARSHEKQDIHFGLRNGCAVIRTFGFNTKSRRSEVWEFVPQSMLTTSGTFDLPAELIHHCGHWLNISTRRLEIRRGLPNTPAFWHTRPRDWIIDVPSRRAFRGIGGSQLVDPHSSTFAQIAEIFSHFEQPDKLTVFQPINAAARLTVELKHLDLHFAVNDNHRLECQQLSAEIDSDQDPGTWYGLSSKIVMRDTKTHDRSIIVPLGQPIVRRDGPHVQVHIQGTTNYASFKIDSVLGRLSCSPEPRIIYAKAFYHAITSFCLPDQLTGKTGSGEAFSILGSGIAQPWTPIATTGDPVLELFRKLIPRRVYYPPEIKRFQRVFWDVDFTSSIQCDGYMPLIEAIKEKSNGLETFHKTGWILNMRETSQLCHRGRMQRQTYDPLLEIGGSEGLEEFIYTPRDRRNSSAATRVFEISRAILSHCLYFEMNTSLESTLEQYNVIGGFTELSTQSPSICATPLINQIEDCVIENWGSIVEFCRHSTSKDTLLFRLGLLGFHKKPNMDILHFFAAVGLIDEVKNLDPPLHRYFAEFQSREPPSVELLEGFIRPIYPEYQPSEVESLSTSHRAEIKHVELCRREGLKIAKRIRDYWPTPADVLTVKLWTLEPDVFDSDLPGTLISATSAWDKVKPEWQRRLANGELSNYVMRIDKILRSLASCSVQDDTSLMPWKAVEPSFGASHHAITCRSIIQDWIAKSGPALGVSHSSHFDSTLRERIQNTNDPHRPFSTPHEVTELDNILQKFEQSDNELRTRYARYLRQSLEAYLNMAKQPECHTMASFPRIDMLNLALEDANACVKDAHNVISTRFALHDSRKTWLEAGALSPLSTVIEFLKLLRSTAHHSFGLGMKQALVSYGLSISRVQRLMRIRRAVLRRNDQTVNDEMGNPGHTNWKPIEYPDWLLLEIDGDILIRAEQVVVAKAIIDPEQGNKVLQLSMGKGKTSCIIPMVEAVLADGQNLSRVIVPKALIRQTAETMQSRLGGLVGREVVHVPYSRRTSTDQEALELYAELHYETQQNHGIMLTCAEHTLSYKLYGWQKFVDSKRHKAEQMIIFQQWLDSHCRDVLDECDFTLSVKTQLNYPSGTEMPVDFHPYRWQVTQELLGLVTNHLRALQTEHPKGIQVTLRRGGKGFPAVQFLKTESENSLHRMITDSLLSGHLTLLRPKFPTTRHSRSVIRQVLQSGSISDKLLTKAARLFENPSISKSGLLLIRGLLLCRIIVLCLSKRWNVQYGLHPDRDPIAVPYEAKGKPSEQAEFGHPDVAILFTCLSFYYAGLTQDQLVQGVQNILQSSDPAAQYEWWISTCTDLPASLCKWNVINSDDRGQMEKLWELLRFNRNVINHYLNHFVFPVHARQFEVKLQACSWDIPIASKEDNAMARTTGFSGTNDNRLLLPLTIRQRDLPELKHTSAEVLSYLLQKRNQRFHVIADARGYRLPEKSFLEDLKAKGVSVLIDVGAYISEMGNKELAQAWLEVDSDAKAAVYFGNDNRAWVHYKGTAKEDVPLLATPFADNLLGCNVFLDEGHTRGVDLRLPPNAHGAVTLALNLTKDNTVQAAMRLRQLRTTQRISFYGPPEVDQSIRDFCQIDSPGLINSSHVTSWLLERTCRSVEDLRGLYVSQGIDFCRRTDTIWNCKEFMIKRSQRDKLLRIFRQPERKTLEELYGPSSDLPPMNLKDGIKSKKLGSFMNKLVQMSRSHRGEAQDASLQEVEQEREVEAQVEQVRQVEMRKRFTPLKYPGMHPDIREFVKTGKLICLEPEKTMKPGFEHAFAFVGKTALGKEFDVQQTSSRLYVSREFSQTIEIGRTSHEGDNYLRPVEWIVWAPRTETALVIIPEEAEEVLELLHGREDRARVHLIAYAAPVTRAMMHFNDLEFYSFPELQQEHGIPDIIKIELGILAGRLYVPEREWEILKEYVKATKASVVDAQDKIAPDPAGFLLDWLTIRRKTVDVLHTPMGFICTGREIENTESADVVDEPELSEEERGEGSSSSLS
ncbi:hypothetical protein F4808DRAFT_468261 [Astrocystis sublimbata]|nr:hypothetical protein F4808DRAFT_468261 [Astrocystis sublimbata]